MTNKKIAGFYYGSPFTGTVMFEDVCGTSRGNAYYVKLDNPITIFGSERQEICVFSNVDQIAVGN